MRPVLSKSDRKIQPIKMRRVSVLYKRKRDNERDFDRTAMPCPEQIDPISTARCDVVEITRLLNCVLNDAIFGIVLIDCMCFFVGNVFV